MIHIPNLPPPPLMYDPLNVADPISIPFSREQGSHPGTKVAGSRMRPGFKGTGGGASGNQGYGTGDNKSRAFKGEGVFNSAGLKMEERLTAYLVVSSDHGGEGGGKRGGGGGGGGGGGRGGKRIGEGGDGEGRRGGDGGGKRGGNGGGGGGAGKGDGNVGRGGGTEGRSGINVGRGGGTEGRSGVTEGRNGINVGRGGVTEGRSGINVGRGGVTEGNAPMVSIIWAKPHTSELALANALHVRMFMYICSGTWANSA